MENTKNYFLVGMFIIITVCGCLFFSIWLSALGKGDYNHYAIRFAESVSGLSVGSPVKFRGVDVGSVEKIIIDSTDTRLIRVDVRILATAPVKTDTVANLKLQGITGIVYVELSGGSPQAQNLADTTKDIPFIKSQQSSIDVLVNRLPILLDKATAIADQMDKLFSEQNVQTIGAILAQLQNVTTALAHETAQIDILIKNSAAITSNVHDITQSSQSDIKETLHNLSSASEHVRNLSESLEENPSRILFQGKEKGVPAP